jgi:hypothetical protein
MSVYDNWSVEELRRELRKQNLPSTGRKVELIAKLVEIHSKSPSENESKR